MPYEIIQNATSCNGFAVVKVGFVDPIEGGCHEAYDDAVAHAQALNIATKDEQRSRDEAWIIDIDDTIMSDGDTNDPLIQYLNSLDYYKVVVTGRFEGDREATLKDLDESGLQYDELHMNPGGDPIAHKKKKALELSSKMKIEGAIDNDEKTRQMYESLGIDTLDPNDFPFGGNEIDDAEAEDDGEPLDGLRAIDLSPPEYVKENCRRGLQYHQEGFAGDGLRARTVSEARDIAAGRPISRDKVRRMRAWIARHMVDLDTAPEFGDDDFPSPGQVAHLLWGSGTTRASAQKTFDWTNIKVRQIEREEASTEGRAAGDPSTPAPPKDQIIGSDANPVGSAQGKQGGIALSEAVETSLANKASQHNARMDENRKPGWTKVTLGALRSVYRRGAGAFSVSHRPGMTRGQWAMGRVNAFLYLAENGKPENANYVGDNDLLNTEHPRYSGGTK